MNDRHVQDPAERRLDEALAALRAEEPTTPLRQDLVWEQVQQKREAAEQRSPLAMPPRIRRVAAATIMIAAGTLLMEGIRHVRMGHTEVGHEPLLADAVSILRALPSVAPGSAAADSLESRSVLLLAATRAAVESTPEVGEHTELLRDVEFVMAQVVEGGLVDAVERELTMQAVQQRRMIERAEDMGAE